MDDVPEKRVLLDGEGVELESGIPFSLECCRCGLVHRVVIVSQDDQSIGLAMRREAVEGTGRELEGDVPPGVLLTLPALRRVLLGASQRLWVSQALGISQDRLYALVAELEREVAADADRTEDDELRETEGLCRRGGA
ncbi:MAG: hypothetical protein AB7D57_07755 [Desulfovibrionaceae bacterium]